MKDDSEGENKEDQEESLGGKRNLGESGRQTLPKRGHCTGNGQAKHAGQEEIQSCET